MASMTMPFGCHFAQRSAGRPAEHNPLKQVPAIVRWTCRSLLKRLVRAVGIEPTRAKAQRIFIPTTAFAAARLGVCGLDYPFTVLRRTEG